MVEVVILFGTAIRFTFESSAAWMSFARLNGLIDQGNAYDRRVLEIVMPE